jgi:hypothetical protein
VLTPESNRGPRGSGLPQVRIDPLPLLKANATYRLEAWVKIKGEGSKVWLSADPAFWTPRPWSQPPLTAIESNAAEKSDEWQKLTVTFTTPPTHGRTPQLWLKAKFAGSDGVAYLDDVSIVTVREPVEGQTGRANRRLHSRMEGVACSRFMAGMANCR